MSEWWRDGLVYQLYPRSFVDSNGDGVGDLRGIVSRLDYLEWLGVDGIWLNPIHPSPNADFGYDVADYLGVHPELGTPADLDELIGAARDRGIRILLDLVPNHTSDRHPWFVESRAARDSPRRDWYVWADPRPDGSPPNNWLSAFGGPAWTLDERTGQYYLHNFLPQQPDLNWWNEDVRDAFDAIFRFWFERGVAGFRIDVANALVKDRELRDNPPAAEGWTRKRELEQVYSANRPEVHDIYRRWRRIADGFDPARVLVGEAWVYDFAQWAAYYGQAQDELHLLFNFRLLDAPFEAEALRAVVESTTAALPAGAWPACAGSNHDVVRFPTRWCAGDPARVRCALLVLLTLPGTPFLYYGDELGMEQAPILEERVLDVEGRDGARTPMPWERGGGFTAAGVEPWLPYGDTAACNVADQREDPDSTLSFCRRAIALRRRVADLRRGAHEQLPAAPGVWAWCRGEVSVAINLGAEPQRVEELRGELLLSTDSGRRTWNQAVAAAEGVVVR